MKKLPAFLHAAILIAGILISTTLFAQGGPPMPPVGPPPGPAGDEMRKAIEEVQKAVDKAAYEASRKALEDGKTEEEAKEAGRKAADEEFDRKVDEYIEKMGQDGAPPLPGGMQMDPEMLKRMAKENMREQIQKDAAAAADRAVKHHKATYWKELEPLEVLVAKDIPENEIESVLKDTTLFEDFKDIKKLKLTKPVIIFFFTEDDSSKTAQKKVEECQQLRDNVFTDEEFADASGEFLRFRVDVDKLNKPFMKKYKVTSAPVVVFFDCTGKRIYSFTNPKQKVKSLVKKMESYVEKSDKAREKAEEEKEKSDKGKDGEKKEEGGEK